MVNNMLVFGFRLNNYLKLFCLEILYLSLKNCSPWSWVQTYFVGTKTSRVMGDNSSLVNQPMHMDFTFLLLLIKFIRDVLFFFFNLLYTFNIKSTYHEIYFYL